MAGIDPTKLIPLTTLGRGSYGKVILARNSQDPSPTSPANQHHDLVAVKVVSKTRIKTKGQLLKNETELRVMREVSPSCDFLVNTLGGFQTDHCLFYLMPYHAGGELFFHLQNKLHFPEREVRQISMQVILAIGHLHSFGIVYRDLKPENVLITNSGVCQLADFGLSKYLPPNGAYEISAYSPTSGGGGSGSELAKVGSMNQVSRKSSQNLLLKPALGVANRVRNIFRRSMASSTRTSNSRATQTNSTVAPPTVTATSTSAAMGDAIDSSHAWGRTKTRCGSPAYQSPEVVEAKEHGLESDWWALGIFIYELFVGHPPFFADTVKEVYELILRNEPRWSRKLTDNARDIVQRLLKTDVTKRLGYGEQIGRAAIKSHLFFINTEPAVHGEPYATWEQVEKLDTKPCVFLSDTGVVGAPQDAVFFHSEYTSMDVREYVPVCAKPIELQGFQHVPVGTFSLFVSPDPIPVDKGQGTELKKM